jgi:hypothetical protein
MYTKVVYGRQNFTLVYQRLSVISAKGTDPRAARLSLSVGSPASWWHVSLAQGFAAAVPGQLQLRNCPQPLPQPLAPFRTQTKATQAIPLDQAS